MTTEPHAACYAKSSVSILCFFFFFSSRRRHTRLQGDWSSDVCSSDLSGHIPGSRNLPYAELFDAKTGAMQPLEELRKAFAVAGVDLAKPIVTTCGSDRKSVV